MPFPDTLSQFKPGENAVEAGRKGGRASGHNKSVAAKLREMKKRGVANDQVMWLYEMAENSEAAFINISEMLYAAYLKPSSERMKNNAMNQLVNLYKVRHGTKETKHSVDVTTKEFKFIIAAEVKDETQSGALESDKEATGSVQLLAGQNND